MLDLTSSRNDSACTKADRRTNAAAAEAPARGHRLPSIRCGGLVQIGELVKRIPWLARLLRESTTKHPR